MARPPPNVMMKLEQWNLWDTLLKSHEKEPKSQRRTLNLTKHLKSASEWLEHGAVTKRKRTANFDASPDASTAGSAHSPPGPSYFLWLSGGSWILRLKKLINTWRGFAYELKYVNVR